MMAVCELSNGQILKVDKNYLASDSSKYSVGAVELSFSMNNRSSTEEEEIIFLGTRVGVDWVRIRDRSATLAIGTFNYTKLGDGPFISNGTGHLRQIFNRNANWTPEAFVQVQYDRSRKMQFRRLIGGGWRWNILDDKNSLHFGIGAMNEFEEWGIGDVLIDKSIWKMNSYLSGEVDLTKDLVLNTVFYFQSGKDIESDVYRSRVAGHLEVKNRITRKLESKVSAELTWDQRPIIPLNRLVYEMFFGLEYDF